MSTSAGGIEISTKINWLKLTTFSFKIKHQIGHRLEISDLEIKETKTFHKMARSPPTAFQLGDGPKWPRSLLQIRQFYLRAKRTNKSF
jgi:hypothetical protein